MGPAPSFRRTGDLVAQEQGWILRSTWEELRRSVRPSRWEGEDDLFDPGLADELDTLVLEEMQTAEIA